MLVPRSRFDRSFQSSKSWKIQASRGNKERSKNLTFVLHKVKPSEHRWINWWIRCFVGRLNCLIQVDSVLHSCKIDFNLPRMNDFAFWVCFPGLAAFLASRPGKISSYLLFCLLQCFVAFTDHINKVSTCDKVILTCIGATTKVGRFALFVIEGNSTV